MSSRTRVLLMAIDGLDWGLLQALVDRGLMPCVEQLLNAGLSGRLAVPSRMDDAATWTTIATGLGADRHGVLHRLSPRQDGLTLQATDAFALRAPALWHTAARAGWSPHVAGWPALLHGKNGRPGHGGRFVDAGRWVSAGFEEAVSSVTDHWPLPPTAAWPAAARDDVLDTLVHPSEVAEHSVAALTAALLPDSRAALQDDARRLVARWSSVQALGLAWAAGSDARLIALRYAGLRPWCQALWPMARQTLPDALIPCYQWIDLLLGRFMHVLGRGAHLVLVTDRGLPFGGYRGGGGLDEGTASGGLVIAGPGVPGDVVLADARAEDICPTLSALMGLTHDEHAPVLDGRDLLAGRVHSPWPAARLDVRPCMPDWPEAPSDADLTLTWLHGRGITPIDFTPLRAAVAAVRHESLAAWAQARRLRGAFADAIDAWQTLLKERPDDLALRVALGEALLSAGRIADCRTLLEAAPAAARTAPWCDAFGGLIAFGTGDWQAAEVHLGRLVHERWAPFNAPGLLGWVRLQHADWAGALQWFEHAASCPLLTGHVWEGMGVALQGLARHRDAAAAFGKAIAFAPGETRLHLQRAEALAAAGATEEARSAWWRAIELEPGSTAAHAGLARLSMETVRAESAAQLARIDTGSR